MATYVPDAACMAAARAAAGDDLSQDDILAAFQRVADFRDKLRGQGQVTGMEARIRRFAADEAERAKVMAAVGRRNAARNVIIHDKLAEQVAGMMQAGVRPRNALLGILEGMQRGVKNARVSVAATRGAMEADYLGKMLSEMQKDRPYLAKLLNDKKLDADTLAEMMELKPGGKPGVTGNDDAKYLAGLFGKYAEFARREHNRLGGMMGKLLGWNGVQMHDDYKMIAGGAGARERWIGYIASKLDMERTFPDGLTDLEVHDALSNIYDTITTGVPSTMTAAEMGKRTGPAGLAKSFAASRVLHFTDAAAALAYREKYGYGNTVGGMIAHLRRVAHVNANMQVLGPNPEVMFNGLADGLKRTIKEATAVPPGIKYGMIGRRYTPSLEEWKSKETGIIDAQGGVLKHAMDIATGLASRPVDTTMAGIGSAIRATQSMAKLGAALPTSFADVPTTALAGMFRGSSFFKGIGDQLSGVLSFGDQQNKEISYLMGEGFEGLIGHINSVMVGNDRIPGLMSHAMEQFFKWNGLTWWTDAGRASAARIISAEMGMRSGTAHADLPAKYQHVLGMNGIGEKEWDVMRQGALRQANGRAYLTPDSVMNLPDSALVGLAADRITAARKASRVDEAKSVGVQAARQADFEQRRAAVLWDQRRDLTIAMRRFISDETSYGVIKTDARSQRTATWGGQRPGTVAGEAIRFLMQFKGFPIAYADRVLGRAAFGIRPEAGAGERGAHIGALLAGLTVAGYMAMTMKDALKGYSPRNPSNPLTLMAALQQGGAVGIYGDYLFGSTNRFGGSLLGTLAGPTLSSLDQLGGVYLNAQDATIGGPKFSASTAFSTALANVPYANLHLVKPVLDYLFLNSVREMLSPGYLRRQDQNRLKQYGQTRLWPDTVQGVQ